MQDGTVQVILVYQDQQEQQQLQQIGRQYNNKHGESRIRNYRTEVMPDGTVQVIVYQDQQEQQQLQQTGR